MTTEDATKVLSILKAAYPNFYKGMKRQEGYGVINLWASQFSQVPVDVVLLAVNKCIGKCTFPPAIAEVKTELKDLSYEAVELLARDRSMRDMGFEMLSASERERLELVRRSCRETVECSQIYSLISDENPLLADGNTTKELEKHEI